MDAFLWGLRPPRLLRLQLLWVSCRMCAVGCPVAIAPALEAYHREVAWVRLVNVGGVVLPYRRRIRIWLLCLSLWPLMLLSRSMAL